jgi:hypothetical protein
MSDHKCDFHAMFWRLGKYGRQDVHLHPCTTENCERELVGEGRVCNGSRHVAKTLTSNSRWSQKEHEGQDIWSKVKVSHE